MKPGIILYDQFDKCYKKTRSAFVGDVDWAPDIGPSGTWWWLDVRIGSEWAASAEMLSDRTVKELRVVRRLEALVVLGEVI